MPLTAEKQREQEQMKMKRRKLQERLRRLRKTPSEQEILRKRLEMKERGAPHDDDEQVVGESRKRKDAPQEPLNLQPPQKMNNSSNATDEETTQKDDDNAENCFHCGKELAADQKINECARCIAACVCPGCFGDDGFCKPCVEKEKINYAAPLYNL